MGLIWLRVRLGVALVHVGSAERILAGKLLSSREVARLIDAHVNLAAPHRWVSADVSVDGGAHAMNKSSMALNASTEQIASARR
jgi:hypothetical protein